MPLSAEEVLLRVAQDAGPFVKLGTSFKSRGTLWIGPALASPLAVYLVKKHRQVYPGVAGAVLNETISRDDQISTCSAGDLPAAVRAVLDPRRKCSENDVVVIPQSTVSLVRSGTWNSIIAISAGPDTFIVNTSFLTMFKRPRQLTALGWTLNQPLAPEAGAVHDTRVDGTSLPVVPLWKKLVLAGVAILAVAVAIIILAMIKEFVH